MANMECAKTSAILYTRSREIIRYHNHNYYDTDAHISVNPNKTKKQKELFAEQKSEAVKQLRKIISDNPFANFARWVRILGWQIRINLERHMMYQQYPRTTCSWVRVGLMLQERPLTCRSA